MTRQNREQGWVKMALRSGVAACAVAAVAGMAQAQQPPAPPKVEEMVVTGSRISRPNAVSTSPVLSIGSNEVQAFQDPEVERIFRVLPITLPGDGQNVNNGTAGTGTVNLRGLGAQRNLLLVNGKRLTPFDVGGVADSQQVPTALIERIDIITGGASAVYGSDAISGAVNFILKEDFEGIEVGYDFSQTGNGDGGTHTADVTIGANFANGRGNVVAYAGYSERAPVLFGQRPLGRLGITTASGAGLQQFLDGVAPLEPIAGCTGPGAVQSGGSPTTLPTRVTITGVTGQQQFRNDGTLGPNCSVFNFNPFNYYQTPQERINTTTLARYEINEYVEAYARFQYTGTNVTQQIAPSGVFGTPYFVPLANPFLVPSARQNLIDRANAARTAGTLFASGLAQNWRDLNNNGVVDVADDLRLTIARRTVELGPRSSSFDSNGWQVVGGLRGDIPGEILPDWSYDVSYQHGEVDRVQFDTGYTNVTNIGLQLDAVETTRCRNNTAGCVPINLFGGFGSISEASVPFALASAFI